MTPASPQPSVWSISGPILVLYIAAAVILLLVREANVRVGASTKEDPLSPAVMAGLAFVSNLLGMATFVMIARALSSSTRLSMLALPAALVAGSYLMGMGRKAERAGLAASLLGSLAGIAAGAWFLMRSTLSNDAVSAAAVSGTVQTLAVEDVLRNQGTWAVSLQLGVFYIVALALFFGLHHVLRRAGQRALAAGQEGRGGRLAFKGLASFGVNLLAVFAFAFLAKTSAVQARLAMLGFPLFLIVESYVKLLRAEPHNRPAHWTGLIGSSGGIALGTFLALRGAPLH
jgi:hypothetical protein